MVLVVGGLLVQGSQASAGDTEVDDARALGPADIAGANDWECVPDPAHPDPVVLVHGGGVDPEVPLGRLTWERFVPVLEEQGYCVFVIDYNWERSMLYLPPGVAEPGGATQLDVFIRGVLSATGAGRVDVVAHSLGAPITRSYLTGPGNTRRVDDLIMLGGPNHPLDPHSVEPLLIYESIRQVSGRDGGVFMTLLNGPHGELETRHGVSYTALGLDEESYVGNPFLRAGFGAVSNVYFGDALVAVNDEGKIPMWPDDPPATHDVDVFDERDYLRGGPYAPRRLCSEMEFHHPAWPITPSAQAAVLEALAVDGPLPDDFSPAC